MSDTRSRMGRSVLVVSTGVLLSRVLGLAREVLFARVWGTSTAMAAFVIAFTIPNLLRSLFGEGTFSSAFVPVFSESLEKKGRAAAWEAACRVVSVLAVILSVIVAALVLLTFLLRRVLERELAAETLAMLPGFLPYAVLVCVAGALGGALNSLKRFAVPALTPLLLNVLLIGAALAAWLFWADSPDRGIQLLVPAVLAAGLLHVLFHLWVFERQGLHFRFRPDFATPEVGRIARLMAPAVIGTSAAQVNIVVDRLLAGWLGADATTTLYFSQRLVYLPVGLFGVASSVVSLPAMSRAWARGDVGEMLGGLRDSLRQVLFLCLPMVVVFGVVGRPLIRLLFERGAFTPAATGETFWALAWYLPGIPFFACVKPAAAAFFARQDTRTPVRIAYVCLGLNVVLNLALMWPLRQGGLALSTSICSAVNLTILLLLLERQLGHALLRPLLPAVLRMLGAAAVAGVVAWLALAAMPVPAAARGFWPRLLAVAVPAAAGYSAYGAAAFTFHCEELHDLLRNVLGRLSARRGRRSGAPPAA